MILNEEKNQVQTNVSNQSKEFTIKTTAKAFKILSGGLYSDKIKAIIRELSCNAWDAHRMAHNTKPFEVHLPNTLESWFSVRDYGIGLSEEDVMNLYSTYFDSTKTGSNNQIGALGLGSKSPFSYTDSFNVTSIFDGESKTYTAYIDEQGTPSIVKVHEEECVEHNGLEVKFAVNKQDFDEFARKSGVVFRIFKTKPEVVGNENYSRYEQTLEKVISGNGWSFYKTDFYSPERAVAIQGNIEYPIDKNQLGDLTSDQEFIADNKFYIDFKIGDLDISASRESLGYDENTVENIKSALAHTYNSFARKLNKQVQGATTLWDAYQEANKVSREVGFTYYNRDKLTFKWGNKSFHLGQSLDYVFSTFDNSRDDKKIEVFDDELSITQYRREHHHKSQRVSKIRDFHGVYGRNVKISITPDSGEHMFIVYDSQRIDTWNKAVRKARQIAKNNRAVNVYLLSEMKEKFFNAMGNPSYMKTSEIEIEKPEKSGNAALYPDNYFTLEQGSYSYASKNISYGDIERDFNDIKNHFYLTRIRDKFYDESGEVDVVKMVALYNFLVEENIIDAGKRLFAIKNAEKSFKRFKEMNWIPFHEFAIEKLSEFVKKNIDKLREPLLIKRRDEILRHSIGYRMRDVIKEEYKNLSDYPEGSQFAKIIEALHENKNASSDKEDDIKKLETVIELANHHNIKIDEGEDSCGDEYDYEKAYPMLKNWNHWEIAENFDDVKAYIIMVDTMKNTSAKA